MSFYKGKQCFVRFHLLPVLLICIFVIECKSDEDEGSAFLPDFAVEYLTDYGYLTDSAEHYNSGSDNEILALQAFQRFGDIPVTGKLDATTAALMKRPRCQMPDILPDGRSGRYLVLSNGWPTTNVTFSIINVPKYIDRNAFIREARKAFAVWHGHSGLYFREVNGTNADIKILFVPAKHGDGFPFKPNYAVAHAFYPEPNHPYRGQIHFNNEERWGFQPARGEGVFDIFSILVHELGHALGLGHSTAVGSVMHPFAIQYPNPDDVTLSQDDIDGIHEIYARRRPTS